MQGSRFEGKGRRKDGNQRKEDTNKGKERRKGFRDSQRKVTCLNISLQKSAVKAVKTIHECRMNVCDVSMISWKNK